MSFVDWVGEVDDGELCYVCDYISENKCPDKGKIIDIGVNHDKLETNILLTDAASWEVVELGITQGSFQHAGYQGSLSGLLTKVKGDINMMRSGYSLDMQEKIDVFLAKIDDVLNGGAEYCSFRIRDPSGLTVLLCNDVDDWVTSNFFERSFEESDELGLISVEYSAVPHDKKLNTAAEVAQLIATSTRVVCLTGAGISVESGIPPFRTSGGPKGEDGAIWQTFDATKMTMHNFNNNLDCTKAWWEMKHAILPKVTQAQPNAAHLFFGYLAAQGKLHGVITQNIDSLHQRGGVPNELVLELHGHMRGLICADNPGPYNPVPYRNGTCDYLLSEEDAQELDYHAGVSIPFCPKCESPLRTQTVMFNQPLVEGSFAQAAETVASGDLLIVIGSSLIVEPANTLPDIALRLGIPLVMVNLDDTKYDDFSTALIRHPAAAFLEKVQSHMS